MKLGQVVEFRLSPRYYQFNRAFAVRDAFDALVELVTNCDDSYHRLFKNGLKSEDGGPILIEYLEQRKGRSSHIAVYDRAEGMTLSDMEKKLANVGTRVSEEGDRGFMARGLRDCTELGIILVESIRDDRYYKCELTPQAQFIPREDGKKTTKSLREQLHIPRGNGTVITLTFGAQNKMPRYNSIVIDLPWHFALRDILAENSQTKALIRNLNQSTEHTEKLVYRHPYGQLVCDELIEVAGYMGVTSGLKIWRAAEPLQDVGVRFRRSGIVIKGERAIHECSLLSSEFEKDPLAKRYYGRLDCPYIDKLLTEFDERREKNLSHPAENPSLLIDPNRQHGLLREHPFTRALMLIPSERLRSLIAKDRDIEQTRERAIANKDVQRRLDQLAKRASLFLKQQLEDTQELGQSEDVDKEAFTKEGVLIFPTYLKLAVGDQRTLSYYAKSSLVSEKTIQVMVEADDPGLAVLGTPFELRPHRTKGDRLIGNFRILGKAPKNSVIIRATCGGLPVAQAMADIVENIGEWRLFEAPLEFEHKEYTVQEGSRRSLQLFARCPEVVAEPVVALVTSSDSASLPVQHTCQMNTFAESNYALGVVVVQGRKLNAKAEIRASVNGRDAITHVRVVSKAEIGIPFKFELCNEDLGKFRAMWGEREGKPYLLRVSARHKSLARYLGPPPEYEGQNAPHFRILLAEIVAEAVCRKALSLESKERTWEFRWADLKEDYLIADDVLSRFQERIRDFVADAHIIMLNDAELKLASRLSKAVAS
ncbi:MAG: hypothetical protein ABSG90_07125 [Dehalococcoidia bacterium]|jgi:hypothetical protein